MKRITDTHAPLGGFPDGYPYATKLTAVALGVMAVFGMNSCIYESDLNDRFFRTLWECTEVPLGPFQADELELEFMCGGTVRLQSDALPAPTYGTYETDGQNAIFQNLTIEIEGHMVTFIDASVSWRGEGSGAKAASGSASGSASGYGDTLFLRWRIENSVYQFTTPMHRLTSYN